MPGARSLFSPLVQALAPRTVRGRLASATLSKPLIRECLVYLFRELLSKFPGSGLYVSRKPHLPRMIRLVKILYNTGRKSCQVFSSIERSSNKKKEQKPIVVGCRMKCYILVVGSDGSMWMFTVASGKRRWFQRRLERCEELLPILPAMRFEDFRKKCWRSHFLRTQIEGLSSLIFPVSFCLANFKLLSFLFCNLQRPMSKNRFEWHEWHRIKG